MSTAVATPETPETAIVAEKAQPNRRVRNLPLPPALPKVIDPANDEHMDIVVAWAQYAARSIVREDPDYVLNARRFYVRYAQQEHTEWDYFLEDALEDFEETLKAQGITVKDGRYCDHPIDVFFEEFDEQAERSLMHTAAYRKANRGSKPLMTRVWSNM